MATRVGYAYFFHERLGKGRATKSDEFSENWQGGGFIFNPKNHIADVGNFKQGFLSIKLIQKSNFRVQGMFFQTRHTLKKHFLIPTLFGPHTYLHICSHFHYKKFAI